MSMAEHKTDGEIFQEFVEEQQERERLLAEAYEEAGTLPPGVVNRNPDTTTPEANYASRDNIVVSGASPHATQAAVSGLSSDEQRRADLDAADVAQRVSREDYEAAVLSAAPGADPDSHPGVVDDGQEVTDEDEPRASGGTQPDEDQVEGYAERVADAQPDLDEQGPHVAESRDEDEDEGGEGAQPEHWQESGPDAVDSDGESTGPNDPSNPQS
jgi:hypothetical protein